MENFMKAVILAGGKGSRLKPYTTSFPKPLMPVGDKPILEILVRQLAAAGQKDIILAVGHLAELIMSFLGDGRQFGVKITYSREDKPLGTIGPLSLIKDELKETFLVINGDTLTDLNYSKLLVNHKNSKCIATIALTKREMEIDFGVPTLTEKSMIEKYEEKPKIIYNVGTGICVFEPDIFQYIQSSERTDLPDLLKKLFTARKKVNGYIHEGYWFDIGRPADYEAACNFIETHKEW
jgi:NDP-sugar pyrophosphorylase family protein